MILRGKFISLNSFVKKQERLKRNQKEVAEELIKIKADSILHILYGTHVTPQLTKEKLKAERMK